MSSTAQGHHSGPQPSSQGDGSISTSEDLTKEMITENTGDSQTATVNPNTLIATPTSLPSEHTKQHSIEKYRPITVVPTSEIKKDLARVYEAGPKDGQKNEISEA